MHLMQTWISIGAAAAIVVAALATGPPAAMSSRQVCD
jgi:hypothetical protein